MKRLLAVTLLSLGAVALTAGTASAWPGCLHAWKCKRKCAKFCVKPYNAFSPVASGTLHLDGCLPFGSGYGHPGTINYHGDPLCHGGICMDPTQAGLLQPGTAVAGPAFVPQNVQPGATPAPVQAQPQPQAQPVNGYPVSAPLPEGPQARQMMPAAPWGGPVNPVGFQPNYGNQMPQMPYGYPQMPYGYPPANVPTYWNQR